MAKNESFAELIDPLKRVSAVLREAGIPHMLGGSLACWARGGPESSKDLDFMIKQEDAERALQVLEADGFRPERPPEGWLVKVWDGSILIDLIYGPIGLPIDDEVLARADEIDVMAVRLKVMALEDVLSTKLMALNEHALDYESLLQITRSLREQVDWEEVRARTAESPYAAAFFTMVQELGLVARPGADDERREPRRLPVRLASAPGTVP